VTPLDREAEVLEQADARVAAESRLRPVRGELDELQLVRYLELARQVGEEDDARLERGDENRRARAVLPRDLVRQLRDPLRDLILGEVPVADARVVG
jgi:hypothetical protein